MYKGSENVTFSAANLLLCRGTERVGPVKQIYLWAYWVLSDTAVIRVIRGFHLELFNDR